MCDVDGGPSGESALDAGTASPDTSGQGGIDLSLLIEQVFDAIAPTPRSSPIGPALPSDAERKRRAQYEATIKSILFGPPVGDQRSVVRRIVEAERWWVPTTSSGAFERLTGTDEQVWRAFTRPLAAGQPERRRGRLPAPLLLILPADPGRPARALSGRELARALAGEPSASFGGVIFAVDGVGWVGLRQTELPLLTQLADSLDLEDLLIAPAPGQVQALRAARWYLPAANRQLNPSPPGWGDPTVAIYTHPDRAEPEHAPLIEVDGLTLYKQLAARGDYVGINVNAGSPVGLGERETRALLLGPSFARGIARGVDLRRGAEPLPARTLAEALLWLDLAGFPWQDREIVYAPASPSSPASDAVLIQVRTKQSSTWRIYEASYSEDQRPGPTVSPVFALSRPETLPASLPAPVPPAYLLFRGEYLNQDLGALTAESIDLGAGQTQILCAGRLAQKLYDQERWAPSRWLVSKQERLRAAQLAGWAHELLKLIPPGAGRLPRSAILSVAGARFLHHRPTYRDRDWIERQHERHIRSAARRFNIW